MTIVRLGMMGQVGCVKDLSSHELPPNAHTDCLNVRYLDGLAWQTFGYGEIYASPPVVPYHVLPVISSGLRYWIVAGTGKIYCVNGVTYTDLTRAAGGDYSGAANTWTSTLLSGIPILNDGVNKPQTWNLNTANKFGDLANWPANTTCKSIRAYKNYLVALNVTKSGTNYPYMVKWSNGADAGAVPSTWDETSATADAGENDLASEGGIVTDGGQLRNDFIIYKSNAMWRMTFVGGAYVFNFSPISNTQGILAKNCWCEIDGLHFVVTGSDIVIHDGQNIQSVVDKVTRRTFFGSLDTQYYDRTFVFRNPFLNEVIVAYCYGGSSVPNRGLVYNVKDKTVSFRDLPNLYHANSGLVESSLTNTWSSDSAPWGADLGTWNSPDFTPDAARVVWASGDQKLFLMDSSTTFNGVVPSAFVERVGLSLGAPENIKLVKSLRPRIYGDSGGTVIVSVGGADDPYAVPAYVDVTHTIGSTVSDDVLVSGRYISYKIRSGTAYTWRLDSLDMDVEVGGLW